MSELSNRVWLFNTMPPLLIIKFIEKDGIWGLVLELLKELSSYCAAFQMKVGRRLGAARRLEGCRSSCVNWCKDVNTVT